MGTAELAVVPKAPDIRMIALGEITPSPTNPRKRFDAAELAELAASVRTHGVVQPVLVRPRPKGKPGFELVVGERRFRACKLAELPSIPAVVREIGDDEVLEIQVIENLQRADIHPLEEAQGYRDLMKRPGFDAQTIGDRISRSAKYVYDRVKLLSLTELAQELFLQNRFTAGHAVIIARLDPEDQAELIGEDQATGPGMGELWRQESLLYDETAEKEPDPLDAVKPISVRELQAWVDRNVRLDVAAPDPMLFPQAALVLKVAAETQERVIHITRESYGVEQRKGERIYLATEWRRADGRGSEVCELGVTGVVVLGHGRGAAFKVCIDKGSCKVHWPHEVHAAELQRKQRELAKTEAAAAKKAGEAPDAKASAPGTGSAKAVKKEPSAAQKRIDEEMAAARKKQSAEQDKRKAEEEAFERSRPRIEAALVAAIKKAPIGAGSTLGQLVLDTVHDQLYNRPEKVAAYPVGRTADDLVRHIAFLAVDLTLQDCFTFDELKKALKESLDMGKVLDDLAAKAEPAPAPSKLPKKKPAGVLSRAKARATKKHK